jgi:hypothetical protein
MVFEVLFEKLGYYKIDSGEKELIEVVRKDCFAGASVFVDFVKKTGKHKVYVRKNGKSRMVLEF